MENFKTKICADKDCDNEFRQFNSLQKYCSPKCQNKNRKPNLKLKSPKPIKKVSDKKLRLDRVYLILRTEFLSRQENKICLISGQPTTEIHHTYCGSDRQKYYLDTTTWMAVSRDGHNYIHDNPKESYEKGWLKKDNFKQ